MSYALSNGPILRWLADNRPMPLKAVSAGVDKDLSNTRRALLAMAGEGAVACGDDKLWAITEVGRRILAGLAIAEGQDPAPAAPTALPPASFYPDPDQPRRDFDPEALQALAVSLAEHGVLQPILVHPADPDGRHRIIFGERRWRAAQACAGVDLPFNILDPADAAAALDLQLIENAQRADINPIDQAHAFQRRLDLGGSTAAIARAGGWSQRFVQQRLQLLKLSAELKAQLIAGEITVEQARHHIQHQMPKAAAAEPSPPPAAGIDNGRSQSVLARIKLGRGEAVALAELSDKVLRKPDRVIASKTLIVDDNLSHADQATLLEEGLISIWDTDGGLIAGVTPDGYAWLAANHVAGAALTGGGYLTDWLNTSTEIAPHAAADRAASSPDPAPPASSEADMRRAAWRAEKRAEIVAWFDKAKPKQILVLAEIAHKARRWPTGEDGDRPATFTADDRLGDPMAQTIVNLGGFFASGGGKPTRVGIDAAVRNQLEVRGYYDADLLRGDLALQLCQDWALGAKTALALFGKGAYATPWLNTQGHPRTIPASPADHPPAGAAPPAVEPRAGEEPGPPRPPMDPSAPGSTPSAEAEPYDPNGWARRLVDKVTVGDAAGVYLALTALMRCAGSPEVSGKALRRAMHIVHQSNVLAEPTDDLFRANRDATDFMLRNYEALHVLPNAQEVYAALSDAHRHAKASAARVPTPATEEPA